MRIIILLILLLHLFVAQCQLGSIVDSLRLKDYVDDIDAILNKNKKLSKICDASEVPSIIGAVDEQCKKSLCLPICLEKIFDCDITVKNCNGWDHCDEFTDQINNKATQNALCSQIKAEGCSNDVAACDAESPWLYRWVDNQAYGTNLMKPNLFVDACVYENDVDEKKKACDACKRSIEIDIKKIPCKQVNPASNADNQPPARMSADSFKAAGLNYKDVVPSLRSVRDRCLAIQNMMFRKKSKLVTKFMNKICQCVGCCNTSSSNEETCFFPIYYESEEH